MIFEMLPPGVDVLVLFLPYELYILFDLFRWQGEVRDGKFVGSYFAWFGRYLGHSSYFKPHIKEALLVIGAQILWAAIVIGFGVR